MHMYELKKNPSNLTSYISHNKRNNYAVRICMHFHELSCSYCFKWTTKSLHKSRHKEILAKFSYPKESWSAPQILQLFDQFCHLIPKELPPPSGTEHSFKNIAANNKYMVQWGWGRGWETSHRHVTRNSYRTLSHNVTSAILVFCDTEGHVVVPNQS